MTKTILLSGGPEDGRQIKVSQANDRYYVFKESPLFDDSGNICIGGKFGYYQQATNRLGVQVFIWKGWHE